MTPVLIAAAAIAGILCPPVVSFLKQDHWSTQVNQLVAVLVAVAAAAIAILASGGHFTVGGHFVWTAFIAEISIVLSTAQVVYNEYFKTSSTNIFLTQALSRKRKPKPPAGNVVSGNDTPGVKVA